jgi:hypothetical protein
LRSIIQEENNKGEFGVDKGRGRRGEEEARGELQVGKDKEAVVRPN